MRLNGIDAQIQEIGDVFVGFAFGDKLKDFAFAWSEQIVSVFGAAALELADVIVEKDFTDRGTRQSLSGGSPWRRI
jgi:hypothetical protein